MTDHIPAEARGYHLSDCSQHNEPAFPNGPCDCGADPVEVAISQARRALDDRNHGDLCGCVKWPVTCATYGESLPWSYDAEELARLAIAALPFLRPEPSEDDGSTWEQVRRDRGWPTPSAVRWAATSIDELAFPKYGDVLRFVADLCDDPRIPAGFTRRPMPSREQVAEAIARGLDGWNDFDDASADYQNELLSGADAVLALFATPGGDS